MNYDKIKNNANIICSAIDMMGAKEYEIGSMIASEQHRTIQQGFMRLIIGFIETQSKTDSYDMRNEATVMLCKELKKTIDEHNKGLPFI